MNENGVLGNLNFIHIHHSVASFIFYHRRRPFLSNSSIIHDNMRLLNSIFLVAYVLPLAHAMPGLQIARAATDNDDVPFTNFAIIEALGRIYATHRRLLSLYQNAPYSDPRVQYDGAIVSLFHGEDFRGQPRIAFLFKTTLEPIERNANVQGLYWVVASCENNKCFHRGIIRIGSNPMDYTALDEVDEADEHHDILCYPEN
ncbi:BgTH12-03190 [Blumeria graminis f. sp. triticale]|uniref:BgTH12-03190 n=2 Tax=Blumeria graminis TaxID=34373 RepID=A0A9W4GG61_BLUGR|nr:BgTH12-03190 [Blumeria graminis f. sp. triticale]